MSNLTLGDYDFQDDDTNSRLTITSNSTNNKIHLNDSGTLEVPNGNINLNGGDITNAGSVSTNYASISDLAAVVDKGDSDQSVSASTVTKVTWSNASTNDASQFDLTNNEFSPAHDGDYLLRANLRMIGSSVSAGQAIEMRFYKNGNAVKVYDDIVPAADNYGLRGSYYYADLTTSDTIDIRVSSSSSFSIDGNTAYTGSSINRVG